jgi:pimeloyl-ACP methyl ester carboxylesterase
VTSFVLIPGAGGSAWYWHLVVPLLREAGHEAIAVDLPGDDETAALPEYADLVTAVPVPIASRAGMRAGRPGSAGR